MDTERNKRITRLKHADSKFYFGVLFHNWAEFMWYLVRFLVIS